MLYFRFLIFFISMLGYLIYIRVKYKVRAEFTPAIFCSSCSMLMFLAGILNVMKEMTLALFFVGLILLFLTFKRISYKNFYHDNRRDIWIFLVFVIVLGYFAILLKSTLFTTYDNFSHWATVVKSMLLTNRMPTFMDNIITFQAYPLGSSIFIYYVCKILGNTDANFLFAQVVLLISFMFPLLVWVKENCLNVILIGFFSIYCLISNIKIYDLMVDTLIPVVAVGIFCIVAYYKESPHKAIMCTFLPLAFLMNIKNSGAFFVVVLIGFGLSVCSQALKTDPKPNLKLLFLSIGAPIATEYIWKKHVDLVFNSAALSKHAMSIENYEKIFKGKSAGDIFTIGESLLTRTLSLDNRHLQLMLLLTMLILLILLISRGDKSDLKTAIAYLTGIWFTFIIYILSLYGMYVFSMPLSEAILLVSYDRYMASITIFLYGIITIYVVSHLDVIERKGRAIVLLFFVFLFMLPVWAHKIELNTLYKKPVYESSVRYKFQEMAKKYEVPPGKKYFIYSSDPSTVDFLFWVSRYEFWSSQVMTAYKDNFDNYADTITNYDYLIIWNSDEKIDAYLKDYELMNYTQKSMVAIPVN